MATPALQQRQITYSGNVQGVGFRYTARSIARGYEVAGYVQNLPTGQVELVAQGSADEIDRFLGELAEQMSGQIRSVDCDRRPVLEEFAASGRFAEFSIRY